MNINITLIGQMITFMLFVFITMRYVWPPITKALRERQKRIAEGLSAAERSQHELELAQHKAVEIITDAKLQAAKYIEDASKRGAHIVEEAKERARQEGERILKLAKEDIVIERNNAKESLRQEIASLALLGASRILNKEVDAANNNAMLDQLLIEVASE